MPASAGDVSDANGRTITRFEGCGDIWPRFCTSWQEVLALSGAGSGAYRTGLGQRHASLLGDCAQPYVRLAAEELFGAPHP